MYNGIEIKQYSKVTYVGCLMDETMSGKSMALNTPETLKKTDNLNTFKHNLKKAFLQSNDLNFNDITIIINIIIY